VRRTTCTFSSFVVRGWDDEVVWCWHEHFGHVNMTTLWKLDWEEVASGLPE
jgi:hypothetical protein